MNIKTKKIEINVPENMDEQTAQQAFIFGLRNLTFTYQGGLSVNYSMEDGQGISNFVFYNKEAGAIIDFIDAIKNCNSDWEKAKKELEEVGKEKLTEIINQNECSDDCSDCHK